MSDFDVNIFKVNTEKAYPHNKKFFAKLKSSRPEHLDATMHQLHEEVFEHTDCLKCANCCKTTSPIFYERDIERAAKHLKMNPSKFIDTYLKKDDENDYVLKQSPCTFLDHENYCMIYESRPTACREYPHTNRKRMYQIMDLTLENTKVCPAVFEISERLKKIF